eukprot:TRINITY_DN16522_c0_g1_i1.p1 TRINITY_DN16522_c0_g1~~TRINITY_DN16522_c0_g1_i1.p1  ORF type:complete len:158 (+),score=16.90 TRINITY_DN16522_c0_g1_i1:1-474(+)
MQVGILIHFECFEKLDKLWLVSKMGCATYVILHVFLAKTIQNLHNESKIHQAMQLWNLLLFLLYYILSYAYELRYFFTGVQILIICGIVFYKGNFKDVENQRLLIIMIMKYLFAIVMAFLAPISMYFYFVSSFIHIYIFVEKILSIADDFKDRVKEV